MTDSADPLAVPFRVGGLRCWALDGGRQRLDGGAMFGVVPRPLWEKRIAPDDRNRIPLALRCLMIEHTAGLVLVDTGVGNKESAKFAGIYGIENVGSIGPTRLEDAIVTTGFTASDIKYVVNTHLHFDHAGGNTCVDVEDGKHATPRAAFRNATYMVQSGELEFARRRNERIAASYLPPNFEPIAEAGQWQVIDGETEILPGIHTLPTPGHVPHHQSIVVTDGGQTLCFVGDLVPTAAHLPLPWIMGYDLDPMLTLETKRWFLERAEREHWLLVLEHDPGGGIGRLASAGKHPRLVPLDTPLAAG